MPISLAMAERRKTVALGDILSRVLDQPQWNRKIQQYSLWNDWVDIVGPEISRHARPHIWRGDLLVVHVDHATWLQELKMMEPKILAQIRTRHPKLELSKIRWEIK